MVRQENFISQDAHLIHEYFHILEQPIDNRAALIAEWEKKALNSITSKKSNLKLNNNENNENNVFYLQDFD
jgi:hypothetical protein